MGAPVNARGFGPTRHTDRSGVALLAGVSFEPSQLYATVLTT